MLQCVRTKPFSPKEIIGRVKSLSRWSKREDATTKVLQYGPVSLDVLRHQVTDRGREVRLTAKECGLLEAFLGSKGRALTRDHLLNTVWGHGFPGLTRTVDVHVRHLREKIPVVADAIVTIKNIGYKLREDLQIVRPPRSPGTRVRPAPPFVIGGVLTILVAGLVISGIVRRHHTGQMRGSLIRDAQIPIPPEPSLAVTL